MSDLRSGTVTFLFADLADARRLWRERGAAMADVSTCFTTLLHHAVTDHGGGLFGTSPSPLQAAFLTVPSAVRAVVVAQRACATTSWSEDGLSWPPPVRMALHAATVTPTLDGDYRAPALDDLHRLLACGNGGQVLLLSTVVARVPEDQLVEDGAEALMSAEMRLPEEIGLRDLGKHQFSGQPAEHVFQLLALGIPDNLPPLSDAISRPGRLPVPTNHVEPLLPKTPVASLSHAISL